MTKNRNRRRRNNAGTGARLAPFALVLFVGLCALIASVTLDQKCEDISKDIKSFENENIALRTKRQALISKMARKNTPAAISSALLNWGLYMEVPNSSRIVRLTPAETGFSAERLAHQREYARR